MSERADGAAPGARGVDLALARLHLRVGLTGLARAELETLAGTADLDLPGILDLAEVRWRTGDMRGAGEAASAYLALAARAGLEPEGAMAYAIVAEAAAARGHEAEAAEAVAGALALLRAKAGDDAAVGPALERLFAGIDARAPWPEAEAGAAPRGAVAASTAPRRLPWEVAPGEAGPGPEDRPVGLAEPPEPTSTVSLATDDLLGAGRAALAAGDPGRAAVALGLALRSDVGSTAAVVAALDGLGVMAAEAGAVAPRGTGGADAADPGWASLAVVRGDALRAAGRDADAALAYDLARRLSLAAERPAPAGGSNETQPQTRLPAADDPGGRPPGGTP